MRSSKFKVLEESPNDYRNIPSIPLIEELIFERKPFLRPNKIKGSYANNAEYLDIQFRLLREDFLFPLRSGIQTFLKGNARKYNRDIRIYENIQILTGIKQNYNKIAFALQFNIEKFKNIDWKSSKRLMCGSLLCLSSDDFKTILFATVEDNEVTNLRQGILYVHLIEPNITELLNQKFTVVETIVYFEAYYHNLEILKNINPHNVPFDDYIVKCDLNEISPPQYINDVNYIIDEYIVPVFSYDLWPPAEKLRLNQSQHFSLQMALTQKFALIQGPPGCGKTFLGLKIVKVLLDTYRASEIVGPILVVCYTNHALDQFLEGIFNLGYQNIIRVGGRSSSSLLEPCQLKNKRGKYLINTSHRRNYFHIHKVLKRNFIDLNQIVHNIGLLSSTIINVTLLYNLNIIDTVIYSQFPQIANKNVMLLWLSVESNNLNSNHLTQNTNKVEKFLQNNNGGQMHFTDKIIEKKDNVNLYDKKCIYEERFFEEASRYIEDEKYEALNMYTEKTHNIKIENSTKKNKCGLENNNIKIENSTKKNKCGLENNNKSTTTINEEKKLLAKCLCHLKSEIAFTEEEVNKLNIISKNLWLLPLKSRHQLYLFWVSKYKEKLHDQFLSIEQEYNRNAKLRRELQILNDYEILKNAKIIGMTTTGAAKYHKILTEIHPKIVIVEEAAEVLEAHIMTSLTDKCEHLILIGDHQQLRPNPNTYEIATKFKLSISLFERMIMNGMPYSQLKVQHRMRPEIALLMSHFYLNLKNHESVMNYENIKGVNSNMFFIQHSHFEKDDYDLKNHSNIHEAKFILALCKYLIQQGYSTHQITILTPYVGQLFLFRKLIPEDFFDGLRICTLDNFQGEENDIILLSLVRSNVNKKIGFLSIENRVCVALSRAKKGFYCIGNFEMFAKKSDLWKNIVSDLKISNNIGTHLKLSCSKHYTAVEISSAEDFLTYVPDGGCMKPCEFQLSCGHICGRRCHSYDSNHENYKCLKKCLKYCELGHQCKEDCIKKCPKCEVKIEKTFAICGHTQLIPCHEKNNPNYKCFEICDNILLCGHPCRRKCGKTDNCSNHSCSNFCQMIIKKYFDCGHSILVKCSADINDYKCFKIIDKMLPCGHMQSSVCHLRIEDEICQHPCKTLLECGHLCLGNCNSCHQSRVHMPCKCKKVLVCGHECESPCSKTCAPCLRNCENCCTHRNCPETCGKLCSPCKMPCVWKCKHYRCTKLCYQFCNRKRCNKPCPQLLSCGHPCIGLCGEICPQACRICNFKLVSELVFGTENHTSQFVQLQDCTHFFEVAALDNWMQIKEKHNEKNLLKVCPKCRTPIRKSLRYGSLIKQSLTEIERIKRKLLRKKKFFPIELERIRLFYFQNFYVYIEYSEVFFEQFKIYLDKFLHHTSELSHVHIIENQLIFLKELKDIKQKCDFLKNLSLHVNQESQQYILSLLFPDQINKNIAEVLSEVIIGETKWMKTLAIRFDPSLGDQFMKEFSQEINRLKLWSYFYCIITEACINPIRPSEDVTNLIVQIHSVLTRAGKSFTESEDIHRSLNHLFPLIVTDFGMATNGPIIIDISYDQMFKCSNAC